MSDNKTKRGFFETILFYSIVTFIGIILLVVGIFVIYLFISAIVIVIKWFINNGLSGFFEIIGRLLKAIWTGKGG